MEVIQSYTNWTDSFATTSIQFKKPYFCSHTYCFDSNIQCWLITHPLGGIYVLFLLRWLNLIDSYLEKLKKTTLYKLGEHQCITSHSLYHGSSMLKCTIHLMCVLFRMSAFFSFPIDDWLTEIVTKAKIFNGHY